MSEVRVTHDSIECGLRWKQREFRIPYAVPLNEVGRSDALNTFSVGLNLLMSWQMSVSS